MQKDRKVVIVLLDYSASSSDDILNQYIGIINNSIFSKLGQYDRMIVMPIDEGSVQEPVKLVDEDLSGINFKHKNDGFAHAQDSVQKRINSYILTREKINTEILRQQRSIRKSFLNSTDILGALRQVTNLTEATNNDGFWKQAWRFVTGKISYKSDNVIVLLSDMIQDTKDCSFNSKRALTNAQSDKYINYLKTSGKIPDFKGCEIFASGATGRNTVQIDNIRVFWNEYFQMTNGALKAYGYNISDKLDKYLISDDK